MSGNKYKEIGRETSKVHHCLQLDPKFLSLQWGSPSVIALYWKYQKRNIYMKIIYVYKMPVLFSICTQQTVTRDQSPATI